MKQYNQGCVITDWMGRHHKFVRCISCLHENEDCRHLRNTRSLMLLHCDETNGTTSNTRDICASYHPSINQLLNSMCTNNFTK